MVASFRKCHILNPEDSSPKRDLNQHNNIVIIERSERQDGMSVNYHAKAKMHRMKEILIMIQISRSAEKSKVGAWGSQRLMHGEVKG